MRHGLRIAYSAAIVWVAVFSLTVARALAASDCMLVGGRWYCW